MLFISWLGSNFGSTTLLIFLVISGLAYDKVGMPGADHLTLASHCVALVKIGRGDFDPGLRVLALLTLIFVGVVGTFLHIQIGQMIVLSTLAVLLEMISLKSVK